MKTGRGPNPHYIGLNPEEVPAAAEMVIAHKAGSRWVLLVEGDSDAAALEPHLHASCAPLGCGGKQRVIDALKFLQHHRSRAPFVEGGLVDDDFDTLSNRSTDETDPVKDRLAKTDWHDLDAELLLAAPTLDRLMTMMLQAGRADVEIAMGQGIPEWVLSRAADAGAIRFVARDYGHHYKFRVVDPSESIDPQALVLDRREYVKAGWRVLRGEQPLPQQHLDSLLSRADDVRRQPDRLLANGHDVARLAAWVLTKYGPRRFTVRNVERFARSEVTPAEFGTLKTANYLDGLARRHGRQVLKRQGA